jgi:hypothetical protein
MNPRAFLQSTAAIGLWGSSVGNAQTSPSSVFAPWKAGTLDIHHLAYGRGNSTFVLRLDGATILIDAGTTENSLQVSSAHKPNANIRPGDGIAAYISREMQAAGRRDLGLLFSEAHSPRSPGGSGARESAVAKRKLPAYWRNGYRCTSQDRQAAFLTPACHHLQIQNDTTHYWSRRAIAEWLIELVLRGGSSLIGINHGFHFSWAISARIVSR